MTTRKRILFALFSLAFLASCLEAEESVLNDDAQNYSIKKIVDIQAELTCQPVDLKKGISIQFSGKTTYNLYKTASFAFTGYITDINEAGEYEISNGYFELYRETSKCFLKGYFLGLGFKNIDEFRITALIDVYTGTGMFEANGGKLQLEIVCTYASEPDQPMNYTINVSGFLENKIQIVN